MSESFYGDEVMIEYLSPLTASEIAPLADALAPHFFEVRTQRRPSPPSATPLYPLVELALAFASGAIAKGFLEELGKDTWRGIRSLLYRLYKAAKAKAPDKSLHAFALNITVDDVHVTFRIAQNTLSEKEFAAALEAARTVIAADFVGHEVNEEYLRGKRYTLEWDQDLGTWCSRRVYEAAGMRTSAPDA